ncbi:MFS transporter [Rhodoplanes roseus]|uniref:MFS transporter n=1 Tax=Rhodoplanes roseus TaxID=29409 RepID=A0A327KWQ1_9BRAD|nr:MFS transporter [Rhodoplanes roseus]RAI43340.1 MFS transporter [Rhodoplanes roseus]
MTIANDAAAPASGSEAKPAEQARPTRFRWFVALLFFSIYTIAAADRANIGVVLPFLRKEFPMSNTEAGALASLFLLAYAIAQLPSGFIYSKFGVRRLFSVSMIATSVVTGLMGTVGSVLPLKIYRFALGLAEGPLPIGITSTINNWFPPNEKGTATGIFLASVKFGPVIVPPICATIAALYGWREVFLVFAVPGVLLSAVWWLFVSDHPAQSRHVSEGELALITESKPVQATAGEPAPAASQPRSLGLLDTLVRAREVTPLDTNRSLFRSWDVWGCTLGYFFQIGIVNVLLAWIPTYLMSVKHYSIMNMGFVAAAPWVGAVIGNLVGGLISDRLLDKRRKPMMMLSAIATAGMMYALINSPADPLAYGVLLLATGVLLNLGFSAYMVYPMGLTTKTMFPIAGATVNTGGQLGGACAPLAAGIILDTLGWDQVFLFMAIASFASFVLLATISEPIQKQTR